MTVESPQRLTLWCEPSTGERSVVHVANTQSLFWAIGLDQDVAKALDTAMSKLDSVAIGNGRLITQISHTTTVLNGSQPSLAAVFKRLGHTGPVDRRSEYFVVTACATTVSMH